MGLTLVAIGGFSWLLPEPDDRFDSYSARMRRTQRTAGPWVLGLGVLVAGVGLLGAMA